MTIREICIPFTGEKLWIEIERDKGWVEFSLRRLYTPPLEAQKILGLSDSQTLFCVGFATR